jgi:hypothetical protein
MKTPWSVLLAGSLLLQPFALADVSYQETTRVTGGSMMGMVKMAGARAHYLDGHDSWQPYGAVQSA